MHRLAARLPRAVEVTEEGGDAGERLGGGEEALLVLEDFGHVLVVGHGELRPGLEERRGLLGGAALELRLYGPREGGLGVLFEDIVDALGVEVFGVEEEAVHVEEAGADGGEAGVWVSWVRREGEGGSTHSVLIVMVAVEG